jgi:hypothetical protein
MGGWLDWDSGETSTRWVHSLLYCQCYVFGGEGRASDNGEGTLIYWIRSDAQVMPKSRRRQDANDNIFDNMPALNIPGHPNPSMRLPCTWVLVLKLSKIPLHGGMRRGQPTWRWLKWHWIIYLYLVCSRAFTELNSWFIILATSVDVKWVFSQGCLLLSHVRSRLSVQSTRALLCLGSWSHLNLMRTEDVLSVVRLVDLKEDIDDVQAG